MTQSIDTAALEALFAPLRAANARFAAARPGDSGARQAVHTVYGGAHLFRHDSAQRLGELAIRSLHEFAPNCTTFGRAIGLLGNGSPPTAAPDASIAATMYDRVLDKLAREPVEDFRIDFEDGYGNRADAEEDACAKSAAGEVARGMNEHSLPPFIGIRVKPFSRELHSRAARTLDIFLGSLASLTGGTLPQNFVVTIPKVVIPEQVQAVGALLDRIERATGIAPGAAGIELMIETPQAIIDASGRSNLPVLVAAAGERCVGAHFGVYDYTASLTITAEHQRMGHPACDFARSMMQVALAGTGVAISDGATNVMPVAKHRVGKDGPPLTPEQIEDNLRNVHRAWRLHFNDVRHSLRNAFYQGWDLHPAQLPTRYAAVYSFFLEGLTTAADRLRNFIDKAAQATLLGDIFDDAATGQGLLNFFLRALNCGAITTEEASRTGLTLDELRMRSFMKIVESRRARG